MPPAPSAPASRHSRPWSNRTSRGSDIATGIALLLGETVVFMWLVLGYSMRMWAAQEEQTVIDAELRAELTMMEWFLLATLLLVGLALVFRAPWTAALQVLAAMVILVLLTGSQHDYDRNHPVPVPPPSGYTPCYSGSGKCG